MKQVVTTSGFDGIVGVYMLDLQNGQEIHFAMNQGQDVSVDPDVAFTASSTIKIPILVSYFIHHGKAPVDDSVNTKILNMIHASDNVASDDIMAELDPATGPLVVTQDLKKIGLENTFMAGFFSAGSANPCRGLTRPPTSARIFQPNRIATTRPLRRIWACYWKMFTNAPKPAAAP